MGSGTRKRRPVDRRELASLVSVGPATLRDLEALGVRSVSALARSEARDLYERLCILSQARHDPCCEDVFAAAVAQARDPDLPAAQRRWWHWSRVRKAAEERGRALGPRLSEPEEAEDPAEQVRARPRRSPRSPQ